MAASNAVGTVSKEQWGEMFANGGGKFSGLFNSSSFSDVTFIVSDGGVLTKIPGHKVILSARSWEFYVSFHHLKLDNDEVIVQDVNIENFMGLLEFCYRGSLELEGKDAWDILKLAYRFGVVKLIPPCEEFLKLTINGNEYIDFYARDTFLGEDSSLRKTILRNVIKQIFNMTDNPELMEVFVNLPRDKLKNIVESEYLRCDEMELFRVVMKWAAYNCANIGVPSVPRNMRSILGDVFWEIRFPTMKRKEIFEILANYPDLLLAKEFSIIAKFIRKEVKSCPIFTCNVRRARDVYLPLNVSRNFEGSHFSRISCSNGDLQQEGGNTKEMSIRFKVSTSKTLIGSGYYAKPNSKSYFNRCEICTLKDEFSDSGDNLYLFSNSRPTKLAISSHLDYIEVFFQNEINLTIGRWYTLYWKFTEEVPILRTPLLISSQEEADIDLMETPHAVLPCLIFK